MPTWLAAWILAAGVLCVAAETAWGLEPWADDALPDAQGLELWLDASRLAAASAHHGENSPEGGSLAVWHDGSGRGRHARQGTGAFRPNWLRSPPDDPPGTDVVRFDGSDDHLVAADFAADFEEFTLFVVARPRSAKGPFRGLISANRKGRNDYTSGFNLDLGPLGGPRWDWLNVEGAGAGGAHNLLVDSREFGRAAIVTLVSRRGAEGLELFVDSQLQGRRPRDSQRVVFDALRLGCRFFRNDPGPGYEQGFFEGDLLEVLLFGLALPEELRATTEQYLSAKHALVLEGRRRRPAPLTLLAPGIEVRELPVALPNLTNLLYHPDGRLLALGYDGRIHALRDTDGDGLEDAVEPYWYEPTLQIPVAAAWGPGGLYVTANQKVVCLRDTDGDGRPDREDLITGGWEKARVDTTVDALGLAFDPQGKLLFGIGCADYTNAYLVEEGRAGYRLGHERGTILEVCPDGSRKIVATGIRFPYTLAYNRHGDLFCTDQEGETWLPGGNPLDELNHLVAGRHYGFPPRHPVHLPDVADEPPVVGFGPQHQSTCGLVFNEPNQWGRTFGPASWTGDALVAGFSRGRLWRTRLVKTPAGYVGRAYDLAVGDQLLLVTAVGPQGHLVVATHSGLPDWGTGPQGPGRLLQLRYSDGAPQVAAAWAQGPLEVRLALDRPAAEPFHRLSSAELVDLIELTYGPHVRAGDRYERLKPPYAAVVAQGQAPRRTLRVVAARWEDDYRTLAVTTDPHPESVAYSLRLADPEVDDSPETGSAAERGFVPAARGYEAGYTLTGVEAAFIPTDAAAEAWRGWLPHFDLDVCEALAAGSAGHDRLREALASPGRLELHGRLRLPEVAEWLMVRASVPFELTSGDVPVEVRGDQQGQWVAKVGVVAEALERGMLLTCALDLAGGRPEIRLSYLSRLDQVERVVPLEALAPSWAPPAAADATPSAVPDPDVHSEWTPGDWQRGRELFFGSKGRCGECHRVGAEGKQVGPDLTNLRHRDPATVLRDILDPDATLNPDFVQQTLMLADGRMLSGIVRFDDAARLRIVDGAGEVYRVPASLVERIEPARTSLMPRGLIDALDDDDRADLITFLTQPDPHPEGVPLEARPAPRSRREVRGLIADPADAGERLELGVVLVAGPKDHGPGEHDYPVWQRRFARLLGQAPGLKVSTAMDWPDRGQWELADLVVMYFWHHDWTDDNYADLDRYLARGGGLVLLHSATIEDRRPEELARRVGLAAQVGPTRYRHGPLEVLFARSHPLAKGLATVRFYDESYWNLIGDPARVEVLATCIEEGQVQPLIWTYQPDTPEHRGRVLGCILGHYRWTFDDPLFRLVVLRAMAWAAGKPAAPLERLATSGVPLRDE